MAPPHVSLVLSGSIALGAYRAGAYAALHEHRDLQPQHLAGSSIGAVNAALVAGSPPGQRVERLRAFWETITLEPAALGVPWLGIPPGGPWRHTYNWLSVLQTRLFGRAGAFRPRTPEMMLRDVTSLYDLAPLRARLEDLIDFERLNSGELRVSVVATDVETGQEVVFDNAKGDRIGPDHLLASCGFLPDFPPVEIDGRLLGDGGLVSNAPFERVLLDADHGSEEDHLCFVVDLFSPEGGRPTTLEEAAARRWDLFFGNQSRQRLKSLEREYQLQWALSRLAGRLGPKAARDPELAAVLPQVHSPAVKILYLSYQPPAHEAGPEKPFDFARATLADRWKTGFLDMAEAVRLIGNGHDPALGITIQHVQRQSG